MELSPGSFRTFVVGTSYQLGNLASSASSTIESTIGSRFPLPPNGKTKRYKYGLVMCIFMGCVYLYVIVLTFVGPEYLKRSFQVREDSDIAEAAGHDTIEAAMRKIHGREASGSDREDVEANEKGNNSARPVEKV
jgi:SHS family lactate transporter-like MFS transporter